MNVKNKGLYHDTLINNKWYWPHYINGEKIKANFTNKGVETVDAQIDNVSLHVFDMKEEDYVVRLMYAYGKK